MVLLLQLTKRDHHRDARDLRAVVNVDLTRTQAPLETRQKPVPGLPTDRLHQQLDQSLKLGWSVCRRSIGLHFWRGECR